jgi:hypothetical protein
LIAQRLGSVVTDLVLEPDPRPYPDQLEVVFSLSIPALAIQCATILPAPAVYAPLEW